MTTDATPATPQAGGTGDTSAQAATTTSSATQADADTTTTISLDEAKKLRAEARSLRDRLKAFEDAEKQRQDAQLSEQERLTKQLADLQKAHDTAIAKAQRLELAGAIMEQARKLGFTDPDDAVTFLLKDGTEIEAANVEGLLKDLVKAKPHLVGTQQTFRASSGGATNPSRSASNASNINEQYVRDLLGTPTGRETYARMSQAQRDEVQATLLKMNKGR